LVSDVDVEITSSNTYTCVSTDRNVGTAGYALETQGANGSIGIARTEDMEGVITETGVIGSGG
jgi:hypothetical protein